MEGDTRSAMLRNENRKVYIALLMQNAYRPPFAKLRLPLEGDTRSAMLRNENRKVYIALLMF